MGCGRGGEVSEFIVDDFFKDVEETDDTARQNFVRRHVDGERYIGRHTQLEAAGGLRKACCPLHHEKTPSFIVYPKGHKDNSGAPQLHASFYCFGCHAGGDVIEFKRRLDGLQTRHEACIALEAELGLVYDEADELAELRFELVDMVSNRERAALSLTEVNMLCSMAMRRYLRLVNEQRPELIEREFEAIKVLHGYLDVQLGELSAREAEGLPTKINKAIDDRVKMLAKLNDG